MVDYERQMIKRHLNEMKRIADALERIVHVFDGGEVRSLFDIEKDTGTDTPFVFNPADIERRDDNYLETEGD